MATVGETLRYVEAARLEAEASVKNDAERRVLAGVSTVLDKLGPLLTALVLDTDLETDEARVLFRMVEEAVSPPANPDAGEVSEQGVSNIANYVRRKFIYKKDENSGQQLAA